MIVNEKFLHIKIFCKKRLSVAVKIHNTKTTRQKTDGLFLELLTRFELVTC